MSYILDALKKSEQARLNAASPPEPMLLRDDDVTRERHLWPYVVGALLLLNGAALYVWLRSSPEPVPIPAPRATSAPAKTAPAPTAANKTMTVAPVAPVAPVTAPTPEKTETTARASPPAVAVATPPPATTLAPATAPTSEMPEALRKELPPLVIAGVMREQGASVLVVVNERPLREGDEVAPGLKVEKILENGVQFSYKGYRFQR